VEVPKLWMQGAGGKGFRVAQRQLRLAEGLMEDGWAALASIMLLYSV
jgi:hypothetical protein